MAKTFDEYWSEQHITIEDADVDIARNAWLAATSQAANFKVAYDIWQDKTDWVQETATPRELGKHRADVLKDRIALLKTRCDDLEAEADRLSKHATALREIAGRRGKSVMNEIVALKMIVSNFKDADIIKTGREMAHNLSGNGFLFRDEEQFVRFARELVARALGCESD